jgi:hypothetical protein
MLSEGYVPTIYNIVVVGGVSLWESLNYAMIFTKVHKTSGDILSSLVKA